MTAFTEVAHRFWLASSETELAARFTRMLTLDEQTHRYVSPTDPATDTLWAIQDDEHNPPDPTDVDRWAHTLVAWLDDPTALVAVRYAAALERSAILAARVRCV